MPLVTVQRAAVLVALVAVSAIIAAGVLLTDPAGNGRGSSVAAPSSATPVPPMTPAPVQVSSVEATPTATPAEATPSPTPRPPPKSVRPTSAEPEELTGYVWPLRNAYITSPYGSRKFGTFVVIEGEEYHDGLDLAVWCGTKVRAAHDGVVLVADRNFDPVLGYRGDAGQIYARLEQSGNVKSLPVVVVIDDGNGYRSVYVHLSDTGLRVGKGDHVEAGEVIGLEGRTGYATGCHLHYSLIRMDGEWQTVVPELVERYGYPPYVRERVDPLRVLPRDDQYAPERLRPATPAPTPTADQSALPGQSTQPAESARPEPVSPAP
ncbi:MAG TPA: M23 family metallopeptidase [Candidatus Limnocylindria bacterium]|jgi:murein DD-endopeptidase MepM/ murein hydrolase activator NlpD|nr:M23 family metallopeptidase [Candidatus Limnocylindria bacterium]